MASIKKLKIGGITYDLGQTYSLVTATSGTSGLMSGDDKIKLDALSSDLSTLTIAKLDAAEDGYASSYQLQKIVDGVATKVGATINIPKDQFLSGATITEKSETTGEGDSAVTKKYLTLTFTIANGTNKDVDIPITDLINPAFGNGLEVGSDGVLKVKIDSTSDSYLTVGEGGLKLSGVKSKFDSLDTTIGTARIGKSGEEGFQEATGLNKLIQDNTDAIASLKAASKDITTGTNNHVTVSLDETTSQYKISGDTTLNTAVSFAGLVGDLASTNYLGSSTTLSGAAVTLDSTIKGLSDSIDSIWYDIDGETLELNIKKKTTV